MPKSSGQELQGISQLNCWEWIETRNKADHNISRQVVSPSLIVGSGLKLHCRYVKLIYTGISQLNCWEWIETNVDLTI